MKSVMKHMFSEVPRVEIPRSSFDRSHGFKTTFNSGYLVPCYVDEVLPGDTFNLHLSAFGRMATPLHPFMDNMFMEFFFFCVPLRLIWGNFQKAMGEQVNPGDSTSYLVPTMTSTAVTGYSNLSLHDYFGIPTKVPGLTHSALWHRAYNLIYNQWFRDQNLQNSVTVDKGDGPDTVNNYVLLRRGKRHDYFTSCLPWPQKGSTSVSLPLGTSAPVLRNTATTNAQILRNATSGAVLASQTTLSTAASTGALQSSPAAVNAMLDPNGTLYADLSAATAATINQLRQSFQIQKLLERDARGGTRYTEIVQSHFGVKSPDGRLQRPEYLGGGSSPVVINPIAQTSATGITGGTMPAGTLAGMGTMLARQHGFTQSFNEHGMIIGLGNVRADLTYQQGLRKMWSRSTRYDFYFPAFANLGEQSVLNKEIYCDGSANDSAVFGYQERFGEMRYHPSQVTGLFRSTSAGTLDLWHLAQKFSALPTLNQTFIEENPPVDRVIAVPSSTGKQFLLDTLFEVNAVRPLPMYGVPGLIDHF